jgi:Skp family chaperone for outer membrane proteins
MKSTTRILTAATVILATIIVTMVVTPANATKRYAIESGDIAFVDVFTLVDRALTAEDKKAERDGFNATATEKISSLQGQLQAIQTQLSTMQQGDPDAAAAYQQYQNIQYQYDNASSQINTDYQTLIAKQISSAYAEIYAAANEVGQSEGFAFVFATRSDGELIQTDTITGITQEILARPLMTPTDGIDLTELVRLKLGYPEEAPEPIAEEAETVDPTAPQAEEKTTEEPAEQPAESPTSEEE